jgi:hypothetical protein
VGLDQLLLRSAHARQTLLGHLTQRGDVRRHDVDQVGQAHVARRVRLSRALLPQVKDLLAVALDDLADAAHDGSSLHRRCRASTMPAL